ncbi:MAG: alpha/beta fold hydrolase [Pirellulaceae bacterium]|nr:alpha/beta fold hydrolase [Pirellulaceae bacterium]
MLHVSRHQLREVALHVVTSGSGPALLLVHGFPLDHGMWRGQFEELADSYRLIAPDLRGFGRSQPGSEPAATMDRMADDLAELLDALRVTEPVTLCGLSMGGYVALAFWRRHGERLGRLILCDTRAAADTPETAAGRLATAAAILDRGTDELAESMLERLFAERTWRESPALVESIRQVMRRTPARSVAAALRGMAQRVDMTEALPRIHVPALVICGEYDAISPPEEMRGLAAALPRAEYVQIAGAGHMAPLEEPAAVNRAIRRFLAETEVDAPS